MRRSVEKKLIKKTNQTKQPLVCGPSCNKDKMSKPLIRVYFKDSTFKTVQVTDNTTCAEICEMLGKKMYLSGRHFKLVQVVGGQHIDLQGEEKPLYLFQQRPQHVKFICQLRAESIRSFKKKVQQHKQQRAKLRSSIFHPPTSRLRANAGPANPATFVLRSPPSSQPTNIPKSPSTPRNGSSIDGIDTQSPFYQEFAFLKDDLARSAPNLKASPPSSTSNNNSDSPRSSHSSPTSPRSAPSSSIQSPRNDNDSTRNSSQSISQSQPQSSAKDQVEKILFKKRSFTSPQQPTNRHSISVPRHQTSAQHTTPPSSVPSLSRNPSAGRINNNATSTNNTGYNTVKGTTLTRNSVLESLIENWTAEDVCAWLSENAMSEYCEVFSSEAIDGAALCELTEDDLQMLGVKMGHRKKIIKFVQVERANPTAITERDDLDDLILRLSGLDILSDDAPSLDIDDTDFENFDVESFLSNLMHQLQEQM